jgi:hypothetical protein
MLCISCQNSSSTERCRSAALQNLQFCGRHIKVKTPRLWVTVNNIIPKVILIQKIWRGFCIRNWLAQAGVGVLKRSLCHNDEELVTFESKDKTHPFDYFSFEENDKIWWFDIKSLAQCSADTVTPQNPYTRQPLSLETRIRMRQICRRKSIYDITTTTKIWIQVCQMLEENGFDTTQPAIFESLNKTQYLVFLHLLKSDLEAILAERPQSNLRKRQCSIVKHVITKYTPFQSYSDACRKVSVTLLNLLRMPKSYNVAFAIMSSFTRL